MSALVNLAGKLPGANLIRALPGGSKLPGMAKKGATPMQGTAPPGPGYPMTARLSMAYGPGARLNQKRARAAGMGAVTGAMGQASPTNTGFSGQGFPGGMPSGPIGGPTATQQPSEPDPTDYTTQPVPWR